MSDVSVEQTQAPTAEAVEQTPDQFRAQFREEVREGMKADLAAKTAGAPAQSTPAVSDNPNAAVAAATGNVWDEMAKEFQPKPEPPDPEDTTPDEVKKASGYQKLKAEKLELQNKIANFEQQLAQLTQQRQQAPDPRVEAQSQQIAQLTATIERLLSPAPAQPDPNDPFNQLHQGLAPRIKNELLSPVEARLQTLEQELQKRDQAAEQARKQAELAQLATNYRTQATGAIDSILGQSAEITDPAVKDLFFKTVVMLAHADKTTPEEAARKLKYGMVHFAQGVNKRANSGLAQKQALSTGTPRPLPDATVHAANDNDWPDFHSMRAAGFKSYADWEKSGRPAIRSRK